MPADMLAWWPRTETGLLRTRAADLERLAAVPEIRPLLDVIHWDKRLRSFGHVLLERVGADGRLRMDLKPAWTKTGRCSCSDPNLQQLPQDVRRAVVAPAGRTLVIADYGQIELRIAAELSGDEAMRQVFRRRAGHAHAQRRGVHRREHGGAAGGGAQRGAQQGEADRVRHAVRQRPARARGERLVDVPGRDERGGGGRLQGDLLRPLSRCCAGGRTTPRTWRAPPASCARSPAGRSWPPGKAASCAGRSAATIPVQSSAADVMLIAMARVHAALEGRDAGADPADPRRARDRVRRGHRGRGRGAARGAHDGRLVGAVSGRSGRRPGRCLDPALLGKTGEVLKYTAASTTCNPGSILALMGMVHQ